MIIFTGCTKTPVEEEVIPTLKPATETPEPTKEPETLVVTDKASIEGMAKDICEGMTLEEKIGQLFIVNMELLDSSEGSYYEFREITDEMKANIEKYNVGGVVFFARNIETRDQTMEFIDNLQEVSKYPLFISVDEEGGEVARIGQNKNMKTTVFPTMEEIGNLNDKEYAFNIGKTIGEEIKELGFNLNYAPVADVRTNEANTEIGTRSFGSNKKVVASMVRQVVKGLQSQGISATLKHFPGHGDAAEDSHKGAVNVQNDLTRMREIDFVPFKAGVKAGVDFIMVSHISISRVTENTVPASLSSLVMNEMIRTELGFDGVIITDAMNMKAITNDYKAGKAAVLAVEAGTDVVLMPDDLEEAYTAVLDAVKDGTLKEEKINKSVRRILEVKVKRGSILSDTDLIPKKEK